MVDCARYCQQEVDARVGPKGGGDIVGPVRIDPRGWQN